MIGQHQALCIPSCKTAFLTHEKDASDACLLCVPSRGSGTPRTYIRGEALEPELTECLTYPPWRPQIARTAMQRSGPKSVGIDKNGTERRYT